MANSQTTATSKYQKKIGLISKSYKLKKELTEAFADACKRNGVGQAATLSRLMQDYIDASNQQ